MFGWRLILYVCARKKGSNHRKKLLRLQSLLRWWKARGPSLKENVIRCVLTRGSSRMWFDFLYFRLVVISNHMTTWGASGPKIFRDVTKDIYFVKLIIWNIAATRSENPISRKFLLRPLAHEFQLYQSDQQENSNNNSKHKTKPKTFVRYRNTSNTKQIKTTADIEHLSVGSDPNERMVVKHVAEGAPLAPEKLTMHTVIDHLYLHDRLYAIYIIFIMYRYMISIDLWSLRKYDK